MKKIWIFVLCAVFIFSCAGCAREEKAALREIVVPVLGDAEWLESDGAFLNGVRLAEEELNAEYAGSGFVIKTSVVDDGGEYVAGVEAAAKLADDPVVTAVLNLQDFDVSKSTATVLADSGKLAIFPYGAYDSLFTRNNPYIFCGIPSSAVLGRVLSAYAVRQGYRRIAVYHNGSQSQEDLAFAFELGLLDTEAKVVDYVPSISSEDDIDGIYTRWQALGVDCVVILQYGTDRAFQVLKMLRSADQDIPVIGEPVFNSAGALATYKEIAEGMAVPSTLAVEDSEQLQAFLKRYSQKYGREADIWAVQGYDMLRLVADTAVRLDTNDPQKIALGLHDKNGYRGIGQQIAFSEGGALQTDAGSLPVLICRDGRFS